MGGEGVSSAAPDLSVLVVCHHHVCAISTRWVERLLVADDVVRRPAAPGCDVVEIERDLVGAFSLGELLGLDRQENAWILLRIPVDQAQVRVALAVGACLSVVPEPTVFPLPASLFRKRAGAIRGFFLASEAGVQRADLPIGLVLELPSLLTSAELQAAQSLRVGVPP